MKNALFLWVGALACLAGAGCKKNNSGQSGSESCLIDGNPWVANAAALATDNPDAPAGFTYGDSIFVVNGQDTGDHYILIDIQFDTNVPGFSVGTPIALSGNTSYPFLDLYTPSSCLGTFDGIHGIAISGSLTITTLDTARHEVAGTFSAIVPMSPCDTVQITNGRFDQYVIEL